MTKTFPGQNLCSGTFGGNIRPYTKQRARHGSPFLELPPPPSPGAHATPPPPPRKAIFGSPFGVIQESVKLAHSCRRLYTAFKGKVERHALHGSGSADVQQPTPVHSSRVSSCPGTCRTESHPHRLSEALLATLTVAPDAPKLPPVIVSTVSVDSMGQNVVVMPASRAHP